MDKEHKNTVKEIVRFFIRVVVMVTITAAVILYVLFPYRHSGNNMFPAVKDGDLCFIYKLDNYHLNDIVLVEYDGKEYLQRIVAVQDQKVDFPTDGGYTVNDYQPTEEIMYKTEITTDEDKEKFPMKIGTDEYFLLNDFRSDETDGRKYGAVKKAEIKGKIIFMFRRRGF